MGKIRQGILGGVSGAVGNVVGATWKGINYLRIKADNYTDAKSEKQVLHRAKFSACVALAKFLLETVIRPIWNKKAIKMTGYNLFVKTNIGAFGETGDISDFDKLQISVGDLRNPLNLSVTDDENTEGGISISWDDNSGEANALANDKLRVLAICEGDVVELNNLNITRDAGTVNVQLPFGAGVEAHVYTFFESVENYIYSPSIHQIVSVS